MKISLVLAILIFIAIVFFGMQIKEEFKGFISKSGSRRGTKTNAWLGLFVLIWAFLFIVPRST